MPTCVGEGREQAEAVQSGEYGEEAGRVGETVGVDLKTF